MPTIWVNTRRVCYQLGCPAGQDSFFGLTCYSYLHSTCKNIFKALALWADAFYKSKCPSVCVFVRLSVCLLTFEVPFNGLFTPTSRSQMSNIFRDSESLGKSNGKKWSNIWTFLFGSCLKSPRKKKRFFCWFCLTKHGGNQASRWIRDLWSKGVSLILAYLSTILSFCIFGWFFCFSKKSGFWVFLVHPETTLSDELETSGRRAYR